MSMPSPMSHTSKLPPSAASSAHQRPAPSTVFAEHEHEQACCFDERGRLCSRHLRARQPREVGEAMLGETRLRCLEPPQPGLAHPGLDRTCLHVVLPVLRDNRGELTLRRLVSDLAADYPTLELTRFPLEF